MIDQIYGDVEIVIGKIGKTSPHRMVMVTTDLGYEVFCSSRSIKRFIDVIQKNERPACHVFVYEHVTEKNPTKLYGFWDEDERELFTDLLTADGVGPKGALSVCSLDEPANVRQAIRLQNPDYLRRAHGVGQKAADNIVLKLAGRMGA
jgi:Holliday junction DNA helicase RuvA